MFITLTHPNKKRQMFEQAFFFWAANKRIKNVTHRESKQSIWSKKWPTA